MKSLRLISLIACLQTRVWCQPLALPSDTAARKIRPKIFTTSILRTVSETTEILVTAATPNAMPATRDVSGNKGSVHAFPLLQPFPGLWLCNTDSNSLGSFFELPSANRVNMLMNTVP